VTHDFPASRARKGQLVTTIEMTGTRENPLTPDQARQFVKLWRDVERGTSIEALRQAWALGRYRGCPADLARELVNPPLNPMEAAL
jgi:hypothetical protein